MKIQLIKKKNKLIRVIVLTRIYVDTNKCIISNYLIKKRKIEFKQDRIIKYLD